MESSTRSGGRGLVRAVIVVCMSTNEGENADKLTPDALEQFREIEAAYTEALQSVLFLGIIAQSPPGAAEAKPDNGEATCYALFAVERLEWLLQAALHHLYQAALAPVADDDDACAREQAGRALAKHFANVLRDADAARKARKASNTSRISKLLNGVEGAPANAAFAEELKRPVVRKGRVESWVTRWMKMEIELAIEAHSKGLGIYHGVKLPAGLRSFGAHEEDKKLWREQIKRVLQQRFRAYAEQPAYVREQRVGAPAPKWQSHSGSTLTDAFENCWATHSTIQPAPAKT